MAEVEINDLGSIGVITDQRPYMIPPEAWTTGLNVRVTDTDITKMAGWAQTFGTPPVPPHFLMSVKTVVESFWLYTSLDKAYVWDGSTHTDVTRTVGGDYGTTETRQWNGTLLGGIPIINNGVDVPQFWSPSVVGTPLADLTNWPANLRAKVVRAFGPFLMAIGISKSGTAMPHMVKWSHPADPGSVPITWDETDGSHDAGEVDFPDSKAGLLVDMLPLGETMYIYKDASVRKCRYVGGREIFDFGQSAWLTDTGILAPRCVCVTGDGTRQVWASQDDILWHDGQKVRSLLTGRRRRELFNRLDTVHYNNSFMFVNPFMGEVWFCYVSTGSEHPNRALVFNYLNGGDTWPITDADGITFRNADVGSIANSTPEIWDSGTDIWDTDTGPWETLIRRRVILAAPAVAGGVGKFYDLDNGPTRDGAPFSATLQRLGLAVLGKKRNGDWIVDFDRWKMWDTIWPRITGQGSVRFRVGYQTLVDGAVKWGLSTQYTMATDIKVDTGPVSGRALAIELIATNPFRFSGYKTTVQDLGNF